MPEYVVGVDTGASKSHLALFDTEGNLVDFGRWGPLNHELMPGSFTQFADELNQFTAKVLSAHNIKTSEVAHSVFGIAGVDTKKQHGIISGIISAMGFGSFTLCNDAFLGIPAGSKTGTGICANNGSGCTLAGINKKGLMLQIGGVGVISEDKGGGGYLGDRVVAAVYCELFRKGEPTIMTPLLFEMLGITDKHDFVETIYENTEKGSFHIHKSGRIAFEAVRQNDRVAAGILREVADNYANGISCMIEELQFPREDELNIVLAGSVFVKGEHPLMINLLKEKVNADNPGWSMAYTLLDVPNVAGAAIWALNTIGSGTTYHDKVCQELHKLL